MKDGDFDRLRIPIDAEPDEEDPIEEAQRLGVAATPTRLAAGSAIIAGLILAGLAAVRRRRGSGGPSGTDGAA
jgi:uncharacterized protein (TIGR03382 family)